MIYPVLPFLALAFADKAFLECHHTPKSLREIQVPLDQSRLLIPWKASVLSLPIFRAIDDGISGNRVSDTAAITLSNMCPYLNRLGKSAGCEVPLHPSSIRRILSHKESSTENIVVDTQTSFINSDSKAKVLKEMGQCYIRRGEPTRLSLLQIREIYQDPSLRLERQRREKLNRNLSLRYESVKGSTAKQGKFNSQKLHTVSRRLRKLQSRQALHDIYSIVDIGSVGDIEKVSLVEPECTERLWLAKNLPDWVSHPTLWKQPQVDLKTAALEHMSRLCGYSAKLV